MTAPSSEQRDPRPGLEAAEGVFQRVICGLDATPQSLEAVRQAERLRAAGGTLTVISALDTGATAPAGWAATQAAKGLRAEAESALDAARAEVPEATFKLVEGRPDQALLGEAKQLQATLLSVGTHGISRAVGIALGSVTTMVLHEAPCSVFVAREPPASDEHPRSIVVGIDGSPESALAADVALALADRLKIKAWPWAVRDGKQFDQAAVDAIAENVRFEDGHPVDMLISAVEQADLLIVGSRGLHGVRALGSVSERVAHKAPCSVLVVRAPNPS
jgi:nucleotide-binding universal stress UspA family protein